MKSYGPWAVDFKMRSHRPSLALEVGVGLMCLLAVASTDAGFWPKLSLLLTVFFYLVWGVAQTLGFYSLGSGVVVAVKFRDPDFEITERSGKVTTVKILPNTVIWGAVIFLNYLPSNEIPQQEKPIVGSLRGFLFGRQLVLTPTAIGQEQFRRLSVLLRYQVKPQIQQQVPPR